MSDTTKKHVIVEREIGGRTLRFETGKVAKLANGAIVTDIAFSSPQVVKGADTGTSVTLLMLGGEVDGVRLEIPGLPVFRRDVRYLVFSAGNGRDMFPVVGGPGGLFQLRDDAAAGGVIGSGRQRPGGEVLLQPLRSTLTGPTMAFR